MFLMFFTSKARVFQGIARCFCLNTARGRICARGSGRGGRRVHRELLRDSALTSGSYVLSFLWHATVAQGLSSP